MSPDTRGMLAASVVIALASPAVAQQGDPAGRPAQGPAPATNPVGEYSGVEPGEAPVPVRRVGKRPRVMWIGFQPGEGGGARLFVQLDRDVSYRQAVQGGALVVTLENAVHGNRNARRHLDTRFFETPVAAVTNKVVRRRGRGGRGIELTVRFKNPGDAAEARASTSTGKDGYTYLLLELGPGSGAAPGEGDLSDEDAPPAE